MPLWFSKLQDRNPKLRSSKKALRNLSIHFSGKKTIRIFQIRISMLERASLDVSNRWGSSKVKWFSFDGLWFHGCRTRMLRMQESKTPQVHLHLMQQSIESGRFLHVVSFSSLFEKAMPIGTQTKEEEEIYKILVLRFLWCFSINNRQKCLWILQVWVWFMLKLL